MNTPEHTRGCIQFTFFGVPTMIRPSSWLMLLVLGSGFGQMKQDIMPTLIFVAAGMLCLLVHEYGHAFTGRALGSGSATVEIASLGGVTAFTHPPKTRPGHLLMVLAGPGASLLLATVVAVGMSLQLGVEPLKGVVYALTVPLPFGVPQELAEWCYRPVLMGFHTAGVGALTIKCYHTLYFVAVWWSLFNLLPIHPMDGGKALLLATANLRLTCMVSITVAALLGVWGLTQLSIFTLLISAWFVWINWRYLSLLRRESRGEHVTYEE